jgi:galactose mutarotase-like enzyme
VTCLEPMMAPIAALSTGEGLELAQPGQRMSGSFAIRVT